MIWCRLDRDGVDINSGAYSAFIAFHIILFYYLLHPLFFYLHVLLYFPFMFSFLTCFFYAHSPFMVSLFNLSYSLSFLKRNRSLSIICDVSFYTALFINFLFSYLFPFLSFYPSSFFESIHHLQSYNISLIFFIPLPILSLHIYHSFLYLLFFHSL
jgi:hypothetical protein